MSYRERDLIIDLGMHDGQDTDYYLAKGFSVVAVEANAALVAEATHRFVNAITEGRLVIVEGAIADRTGPLEFHVNNQNTKWSSLFQEWGNKGRKGSHLVTVQGVRLGDLLAEHGVPRYLKIDIEGADELAVSALEGFAERPAFVSVEAGTSGEDLLHALASLGYDRFTMVNQAEVPLIECPLPATEGLYVDHTFPMGASGLFGTELRESWHDLPRALVEWQAFTEVLDRVERDYGPNPNAIMHAREDLGIGWYDIHATHAATLTGRSAQG